MIFVLRKICNLHLALVCVLLVGGELHAQDEKPRITDVEIGFDGAYKLGCWTPVQVILEGGSIPLTGVVQVTVPDGDGVPTTVISPFNRPVGIEPGRTTTVNLFIRVGQSAAPLEAKFITADRKNSVSRTFFAGPESGDGVIAGGLPATNRLIVALGPALGLGDLLANESVDELSRTHLVQLQSTAELPTEWQGYEGVETLILTTSQPEVYRPLIQNAARVEALRKWVELGGKLVVFCGSQAEELMGANGALTELVPGKFTEIVDIQQSQPLETFSGSEQAITSDRRVNFQVPVFTGIRGRSEAVARRGTLEVPLVIRSYLGFGELTFVGLDFDKPPLRAWPGRVGFLQRALELGDSRTSQQGSNETIVQTGEDIVTQVRNVLDQSFVGVTVVPFALVAFLVVGYILLIGPGDFYLVNKILKRPEFTWISFPLMVAGVSAGAYWYANWQKGDQLRVNQVVFVDFDATTNTVRGTAWTHFFTPQVAKFNLSFRPPLPDSTAVQGLPLVAWLGQPGYALGGMQSSSGQTSLFDRGYEFSPALDAMNDVPVQLWSTKTIIARWVSKTPVPLGLSLSRTDDQLLAGSIANQSDMALADCVLLYGQWAWDLGQMPAGTTVDLSTAKQPRMVKTLLTSATAGDVTITNTAADGTVPFRLAQEDVTRLAKTMMFFHALSGDRYTGMLDRYQSFLDMSHFLDQPDLAVLVTKGGDQGGQWLNGDKPLGGDEDRNWVYNRYLLPVGPALENEKLTSEQ
ncbi:hypothetical protein [Bythopirellula polymerisocia]|uniref:Uncharacterized protein n=1 Tax=Bythopirellula polymerisocia TaxID=2528003 RepID=A0A5C6CPG6_9BACT|nr:hypothetical protein [Bythopirellula polymerisocia]TWU24639.1 hypothetical protein Pla144_35240 [Bythopirellula polymerisocia]